MFTSNSRIVGPDYENCVWRLEFGSSSWIFCKFVTRYLLNGCVGPNGRVGGQYWKGNDVERTSPIIIRSTIVALDWRNWGILRNIPDRISDGCPDYRSPLWCLVLRWSANSMPMLWPTVMLPLSQQMALVLVYSQINPVILRYVLLWSKPGVQHNVADTATCSWLERTGIESRWRSNLHAVQTGPEGPPTSGSLPRVNQPECGAHPPPPSVGGLLKVRSYTCTYPLCLRRDVIGWPVWSKRACSTWSLLFRFPD
jgi:hypothetical protein